MSVSVNPPPQLRIPEQFTREPETRAFFEQQKLILFQLWQKTGGTVDTVSGKQAIILTSSDLILDDSNYGALIIVEANASAVQITLPPITAGEVGESVDIAVIDATFDTTVVPSSGTIFGDSSVLLNEAWTSMQFTTITNSAWIAT